jgi:uncharacterized protein (DUF849 family)
VLLQAALNGDRTKADHQAVPLSPEELAADAGACVAAGAGAIHMHPRDPGGRETLEPQAIDAAARAVREACGVPVGVFDGGLDRAGPRAPARADRWLEHA